MFKHLQLGSVFSIKGGRDLYIGLKEIVDPNTYGSRWLNVRRGVKWVQAGMDQGEGPGVVGLGRDGSRGLNIRRRRYGWIKGLNIQRRGGKCVLAFMDQEG